MDRVIAAFDRLIARPWVAGLLVWGGLTVLPGLVYIITD